MIFQITLDMWTAQGYGSPAREMSGSSALSTFVVAAVAYVYEAIDPDTKIPFYVGRTGDMDRRAREHQKRCMKKIRELMKLKNFRFPDVQRRVPELPNGCADEHAQKMEAYFIFERNTVYHPETCPHGCNSRIGDHGTELTPDDYAELKAMFEGEGYTFPVEEPEVVRDARAECAIAGAFVAMAKEVDDDESVQVFQECHVLAKRALLDAERTHLGLRVFVECVLANYEGKYVDAVDQETLQVELNLIKEKMREDKTFTDLARIVSSMSLVCKEKRGVAVSSEAAVSFLKGTLAMIATREEATLVWTNQAVKARMMEVRAWTKSNGKRKPFGSSVNDEERSLGNFLSNWKNTQVRFYSGACTDLEQCRVLMRGIDWFQEYIGLHEKQTNDWIELNKQLLRGFGLSAEPEFENKKAMATAKGNRVVYAKLAQLVKGVGRPSDVALALKGLPPTRAAWYQELYDANRETKLQNTRETMALKRKRNAAAAKPEEDDKEEQEEDEESDEKNEGKDEEENEEGESDE